VLRYMRERGGPGQGRNYEIVGGGGMAGVGPSILELNAGTGTDAAYFAAQGYRVHATDIAEGMQEKVREKMQLLGLQDRVTTELCSFTALDTLHHKGPYDLIFSNFAGLNCTGELDKVLSSFDPLVKPGGQVTLVILPKFSLWEMLLLFRGKFKTAFRRLLSGARGTKSWRLLLTFWAWKDYARSCLHPILNILPKSIHGLTGFYGTGKTGGKIDGPGK